MDRYILRHKALWNTYQITKAYNYISQHNGDNLDQDVSYHTQILLTSLQALGVVGEWSKALIAVP